MWGDMEMTVVGIREAKMNLSKLLKRVQDGNEALLTDRGNRIGEIVPVRPCSLALAARIKQLEDMMPSLNPMLKTPMTWPGRISLIFRTKHFQASPSSITSALKTRKALP